MPAALVVLQMAMEVEADPLKVASWYRDTCIAELGDLTAAQLVSLGRNRVRFTYKRLNWSGKST